ncbi:hypothetical protein [Halodesulfurarchaeum sp.]|uniref:hypothetical protein n=1 Tax=Halodesulfurarchaeum sp. TaxID=1980530 RepID=UPI002FC30567
MKQPWSDLITEPAVFLVGLMILSMVAVGGVGAQETAFPNDITIETVNSEDAGQVNDVSLEGPREFDVTVGGVEEFGERYSWTIFIDGERNSEKIADDSTITVRFQPEELQEFEEGSEHTVEIRLSQREKSVAAETTVRFQNIDDGSGEQSVNLPDSISIETVNGQDAGQVNNVELVEGGEFEATMGGVETFEDGYTWKVLIDGEVTRETEAVDPTVRILLDETIEELEEGDTHTLEIQLTYRDQSVAADTQVQFTNLAEVKSGREEFVTSEMIALQRTQGVPAGVPAEPKPTQKVTLNGEFEDGVERTNVELSAKLFGEGRLPSGMEVTSVSATSSAWEVDATPTDDGFDLQIAGDGGPESGEIQLTINFDATGVYEEGNDVNRDIQYLIEDSEGEAAGYIDTYLWEVPFYVVVENPQGERLTPNTERDNWKDYYTKRSPPFGPDIDVFVGDGKQVTTSRSPPTEDGVWTMGHRTNHYLRVTVDGYADPVIPLEEIDPNNHLNSENPYVVELSEGGEVAVTLSDQDGEPLPDGSLEVTDTNDIKYDLRADNDGVVRAHLAPDEYTGMALAHTTLPETDIQLSVTEGGRTEAGYSLVAPEVVSADVEHIGGTEPEMDSISVDSIYYEGAMIISLKPEGADPISRDQVDDFGVDKELHDISELGVDDTTEFRITLELDSFEPNSLLWAARDANWEVVESGEETTVVEIETKATEIQKIDEIRAGFGDADSTNWPSEEQDVADEAYDSVVEFWLWDTDQLSIAADYLRGMSVTTNAQVFSLPEMEEGELSIYMAAPGRTVDGTDHSGYYQAYLPDELLEEWNVEDPETELQVTWAGEEEEFDVQTVEEGVYLEIQPVHYSDGQMSVKSLTYEPDMGSSGGLLGTLPWYVLGVVVLVVVIVIGGVILLDKG